MRRLLRNWQASVSECSAGALARETMGAGRIRDRGGSQKLLVIRGYLGIRLFLGTRGGAPALQLLAISI